MKKVKQIMASPSKIILKNKVEKKGKDYKNELKDEHFEEAW